MSIRRKSREMALQVLFCMDVLEDDSETLVAELCYLLEPSEKVRPFGLELVKGVVEHKTEIDARLAEISSNWKLARMDYVDRNIIRIAVYEILFCDDVPPRVAINEAIDIGKRYGTQKSGAFINGILDSIRQRYGSREAETEGMAGDE
ncbi:MAG: transcription antitermination factor NusB [Desulfobacteraceae bacterium]|nr:transcription antitermination factor NusB [Desulfobacteraceae bacterium]MCF8095907.1 transcription antitermination factor NusB [Desulfobacteraceae bacterium]